MKYPSLVAILWELLIRKNVYGSDNSSVKGIERTVYDDVILLGLDKREFEPGLSE